MGGVQAAFLLEMVKMQERIVSDRRAAAGRYRELLGKQPNIKVYGPPAGVVENGYLNVVTVEGKKGTEIVEALKGKQIGAARTYPETIDAQKPAQGVAKLHGSLAHSRAFCERVVNLPLFYGITQDEVSQSAAALIEIAR
jgi:dTDP-4-amino-4,6-dideoxygalactose transaminase